ncbi:MAG: sulfatase [Bacteroidota bacterium]
MNILISTKVLIFLSVLSICTFGQEVSRPNILLITVDDMNWNSVGVFGNSIENITPNIDKLADEGIRFQRAYVTAANCAPSRVSIQTGLYPHQSGARGFYYIDDKHTPTISTELKSHGYYTGIINKSTDTNPAPRNDKYWDYRSGFNKVNKYSASMYAEKSSGFFDQTDKNGKPFYLVVNIADPHKPNFNDPAAAKKGSDIYKPSRVISESEVSVPSFLLDLPAVRKDLRNYYNSVKRADDCVGAILTSLKSSGYHQNTLVIFLSDHGMPFPFAKSSVYDNGLRTPLIMKWPNKIKARQVRNEIVSSIDLFPTILDVAGLPVSDNPDYKGRSLIGTKNETGERYAFGNFDENSRGIPSPMRGVISKEWNYVFNAWSDDETQMQSATMNHLTYKAMKKAAQNNEEIALRIKHFNYRQTEELYNLKDDPDCLINLIEDPAFVQRLHLMRSVLRNQMIDTDDYLLEAFDLKDNDLKLKQFMIDQRHQAGVRAQNLKWKRANNSVGSTKENQDLFQSN